MIMETGQMDGKVVVIGSLKANNAAAVEKAETRQYNVPN